jgi:hypothetical protein
MPKRCGCAALPVILALFRNIISFRGRQMRTKLKESGKELQNGGKREI